MIRMIDAKVVADELRSRYEHARAVTLMGRTIQKALFGGRPDEVVFWALVYAHYCGGDLNPVIDRQLDAFAPFILRDLPASRAEIAGRRGMDATVTRFPLGPSSAMREFETKSEDAVYQVKAFRRNAKESKRAATATEALRVFREMQAGSGVTSCAVFLRGVLVSPTELERAAAREQNLRA